MTNIVKTLIGHSSIGFLSSFDIRALSFFASFIRVNSFDSRDNQP
jgi:hypothetical protein